MPRCDGGTILLLLLLLLRRPRRLLAASRGVSPGLQASGNWVDTENSGDAVNGEAGKQRKQADQGTMSKCICILGRFGGLTSSVPTAPWYA
ncbi:hypothetical protein B0T25DRAFT_338137 [Lasiosphaeria hispida]|uniref:Secreted protein n=1 Tax=Lasiosphaeria hispida TaxID=260671 RepID=A0AAJ0M808_9PEZI|nr:hypothetical protein B0T25DRAFT_338137 [Lasiosphaeria hispida]